MPGMPKFGGVTAQFGKDPIGFLRNEVDYWGSKIGEPFGASFDRSSMSGMGQRSPYEISDEEAQQGFGMTNPQMTEAYQRSTPSWLQRLQERLRRGGLPQQLQSQPSQNQMQQEQSQVPVENPMEARGRALNQVYNQGRNMGQAAQGISRIFGGG